MTVASVGRNTALLREVIDEQDGEDEVAVILRDKRGAIFANLKVGADVAGAKSLRANNGISNRGVIPHGEGMTLAEDQAASLGLGEVPGLEQRLRPYRNGRDLTQIPRGLRVIDMYGLTAEQVREQFPAVYQWLLERAKLDRDQNSDRDLRGKWWLHRRNNEDLRRSLFGLHRYIATIQTAKHRFFTFLDSEVLPDDKLIAIASDDAALLGVLSSQPHVGWSLAAGARLGVGNDLVYNKWTCFERFAFPAATTDQQTQIRTLAEHLDAHRKRQQAAHPDLTLTGMYNVIDKLRSGEVLTAKERTIHEHGLVSVLRQLHDELDAAVLDAYGWSDLLPLLRAAHGLLPSPSGRRAGDDEGGARGNLPKAPLPEETITFARELRRTQTDAEALMWGLLRDRRLHDMKFRRQHPQPPYTLDFYCSQLRLAVELDGGQHVESARDARRDAMLAEAGIEVVRYWNHDVLARTEQVLEDLWRRIEERVSALCPPPQPLSRRERGAKP